MAKALPNSYTSPSSTTLCTVGRRSYTRTPSWTALDGAGRVPGATAAPLDRLLGPSAWATHRRNNTKPPVGVSPFHFRPTDGPAAVADRDTPLAIARPSLLRLEIAEGISHRDLTPLAHSRRHLARQRPNLHRDVCVCVCVCNIRLFDLKSIPHYSQHQLSSSSHPLRYPSYALTPMSPLLYTDICPSSYRSP